MPILVAFDMNATFDGDKVHKATNIHLQEDVASMFEHLPESATVLKPDITRAALISE